MIDTNSCNSLMAELSTIDSWDWSFIYKKKTDVQLGYTNFINMFKNVHDKCILGM